MITEKDIGRKVIVNGFAAGNALYNRQGTISSAEYKKSSAEYKNTVDVKLDDGYIYSITTHALTFVDDENKKESTRQVKYGYEKLDAVLYDAISQSQDGNDVGIVYYV